jgi:sterol desaturase/sphingolipid hydroxylase (fatty acid hydroxylase superfamily)
MFVFIAFVVLITLTAINDNLHSSREDWILDSIGLCFQGIFIPLLQIIIVYQCQYFDKSDRAILHLHPLVAFFVSFVLVDYLYYWNHRLLHKWLWSVHQVHHTVTKMNVLGTSRNTLWASFLIIYLWVHSLFIYLLQDPTWYLVGVSLTSALDLWRHSGINPNSSLHRWLSPWLILPQDHAWHHARQDVGGNYGANLKIWDQMHHTYYEGDRAPHYLGVEIDFSLRKKLFWPL